jgi:hypothetical protein
MASAAEKTLRALCGEFTNRCVEILLGKIMVVNYYSTGMCFSFFFGFGVSFFCFGMFFALARSLAHRFFGAAPANLSSALTTCHFGSFGVC